MSATGNVLLIIGGTAGIGAAIARRWTDAGGTCVVLGLSSANPPDSPPAPSELLIGDARDTQTIDQAVKRAVSLAATTGSTFVGAVHVAGGSGRAFGDGPLDQITDEGWEKTLELNLSTVFRSNRAVVQALLAEGKGGAIVNISSVLALRPAPQFFATHAYAAAKSAIIGLTTASAAHYAPQNIRFNAILPGLIDTPMAARAMNNPSIQAYLKSKQPLRAGGAGQVDDVAAAALWLVSPESQWITGQAISVDGGWSISEPSIPST